MEIDRVPLTIALIATLYMPILLGLYIRHIKHRAIQVRRPVSVLFTAFCAMFCAVTGPLLNILYPSGYPCYFYIVWTTVGVAGGVWFLLLAAGLVLLYKVTNLLNLPTDPSNPYPKLKLYRILLSPQLQRYICLGTTIIAVASIVGLLDKKYISSMSEDACLTSRIRIMLTAECIFLVVIGLYLACLLYGVDDIHGMQQSYRYTLYYSLGIVLLLVLCEVLELQLNLVFTHIYGIKVILATLIAHTYFIFNIYRPLSKILPSSKVGIVHGHRRSVPDMQQELDIFQRFLENSDASYAFEEFCRLALRLEDISTWKIIRRFASRRATRDRAWRVYNLCLDNYAPLTTPVAHKWRDYYFAQLKSPHVIQLAIVPTVQDMEALPWDFFAAFSNDVMFAMYKEILPQFQRHPLGTAWHEYLYQTVHASQRVVMRGKHHSTSRVASFIVSAPLTPIPVSTNSDYSRAPEDETTGYLS